MSSKPGSVPTPAQNSTTAWSPALNGVPYLQGEVEGGGNLQVRKYKQVRVHLNENAKWAMPTSGANCQTTSRVLCTSICSAGNKSIKNFKKY